MKLTVIGSSSAGNSYILENDQEALIIEAGVNIRDIKKALNFNIRKVAACLISHEHGDHAKSAKEVAKAGIKVIASQGTINAMKMKSHNAIVAKAEIPMKVGNFKILPFPIIHDAAEPFGFLINHPETGKVLFVTDTCRIDYDFKGLNNILIEANYSDEITYQKVMKGTLDARHQMRVSESHMSIEKCHEFLSRTDLSQMNNIVLIHLSEGSSNARRFKADTEAVTGKTVTIASKGIIINFDKTPF